MSKLSNTSPPGQLFLQVANTTRTAKKHISLSGSSSSSPFGPNTGPCSFHSYTACPDSFRLELQDRIVSEWVFYSYSKSSVCRAEESSYIKWQNREAFRLTETLSSGLLFFHNSISQSVLRGNSEYQFDIQITVV